MAAAALIAGSLILSRIIGLLRLVVFAWLFNTSSDLSAYNAAFRIPDTLFTIVAGGALSSAFIPVFAGLLEHRNEEEAWHVANTVLNTLFITLVGCSVLAFIFAPQLTEILVPGKGFAALRPETADLTRIMLVQPVLLGLGGLFAAMQNSYRRFVLPSLAPVLYNVTIVLGTLMFGRHFGVYAAAWSVVVGALIMFEIQIWGVAPEAWRYRLSIDWHLAGAREVLRLLGPRLIGLSSFQFMLIVTTVVASSLTAAGFNSIYYAWSLIMFPVGAVGSSVGTAVFPTLSRQSAVDQIGAVQRTVSQSLRAVLFLTLPATVGLILLRRPVVELLFAHGTWTAESTAATSFALAFYALAITPLALIEVVARTFYAFRDTRTPVVIAIGAALLDAVLSVTLIHLFPPSRGQGGLAIATAVAVWLQIIFLLRALPRYLPHTFDASATAAAAKIAVSTLVMGVCVYVGLKVLDSLAVGGPTAMAFTEVAGSLAVGVVSYLAASRVLGLSEGTRFTEAAISLGRRRRG